ncbi:fluoride efflux transporter CrcB [Aquimarina hainanensis]|uniref:Fluoride-specific ion channel FluC n=1 Tax=Aquimarina hainanensis TaxID=1578017 RepID=A0ABW5N4N4_9FLAO|nr:fluoride efflux transporter CrcB [Aquimarina sp. TRL1]QKX05876.1 fluoride efflux transporter CrcB [Aquimarina sp. TRL1]
MKQLLLVFIGGGSGSIARYLLGKLLNTSSSPIPYGTWTANVLGCFFIGCILGYLLKNNPVASQSIALLLATGFCGGFTTFSSFAYENQVFLKNGDITSFALYTFGSVILGMAAVFAGILIAKFF